MKAVAELLSATQGLEAREFQQRQLFLNYQLKRLDGRGYSTPSVNPWRSRIDDSWTRMTGEVAELLRRGFHHNSHLVKPIFDRIEELAWSDMEERPEGHNLRVEIANEYISDLERDLRKSLRAVLTETTAQLTSSMAACRQMVMQAGISDGAVTEAMNIEKFVQDELRPTVSEYIDLEIEYKGEMPQRTLLARLSEGKKAMHVAFFLMMLLPPAIATTIVLPKIFRDLNPETDRLHTWEVRITLIVFAMAWAIVSSFWLWPRADRERREKELERAREVLTREVRGDLGNLQREVQSRLANYLSQLKTQLLRLLDQASQQESAQAAKSAEAERKNMRQRLSVVEQSLRRSDPQLSRFLSDIDQSRSAAEGRLQDLLAGAGSLL
jgi:hypothetical protein